MDKVDKFFKKYYLPIYLIAVSFVFRVLIVYFCFIIFGSFLVNLNSFSNSAYFASLISL